MRIILLSEHYFMIIQDRFRNCKNCEQSFKVQREWQIFCSPYCRRKFNGINRETCFYCGIYGFHREHVFPHNWRDEEKRKFRSIEYIWSCSECNSTVADRPLCLEDKIRLISEKYKKKYKVDKPAIEWSNEEVNEIGPSLRKHIKKHLAKRRNAEDRVIYLQMRLREILS